MCHRLGGDFQIDLLPKASDPSHKLWLATGRDLQDDAPVILLFYFLRV